jgi:hypothetical protein
MNLELTRSTKTNRSIIGELTQEKIKRKTTLSVVVQHLISCLQKLKRHLTGRKYLLQSDKTGKTF